MNFESPQKKSSQDELGKRQKLNIADFPPELQKAMEQARLKDAYARIKEPGKPEKPQPTFQDEVRGKISTYGEINDAYEKQIKSQEDRMDPMRRTFYGDEKQQSEESVQKSIDGLKDSIETNKLKQYYLRFAKSESPAALMAALTKDMELGAKQVEKAWQENIQNQGSADAAKKLKASQMQLRAVTELYDEFNRTSN